MLHDYLYLLRTFRFPITVPLISFQAYFIPQVFHFCPRKSLPVLLIFLPLSFGTAKVETFFYFANFIFYFLFASSPASFSLFSPSFAGCKGINLFLFCK